MPNHKLRRLHADRESNIATMAAWPWTRISKHLDLIDQQLIWANEQRSDIIAAQLEEYRRQIVTP